MINRHAEEYLDRQIEKTKSGVTVILQPDILKRQESRFAEEVKGMRSHVIPITPRYKAYKVKEEWERLPEKEQKEYRGGVGILLHLVKYNRPELSYCTRELSKVMDAANHKHCKELIRAIKYMLDNREMKLMIKPHKIPEQIFYLEGNFNSNFSWNKEEKRSITGWMVFFLGVLVACKSKSQGHVTLSLTKAELVAVSNLCCELLYCKQIMNFLGIKLEFPMLVEVDNQGAEFLSRNECYTSGQNTFIQNTNL